MCNRTSVSRGDATPSLASSMTLLALRTKGTRIIRSRTACISARVQSRSERTPSKMATANGRGSVRAMSTDVRAGVVTRSPCQVQTSSGGSADSRRSKPPRPLRVRSSGWQSTQTGSRRCHSSGSHRKACATAALRRLTAASQRWVDNAAPALCHASSANRAGRYRPRPARTMRPLRMAESTSMPVQPSETNCARLRHIGSDMSALWRAEAPQGA